MAKKPQQDERIADDGSTAVHRPPVSEHPAFPMIVATWFAALLSIGTMVVPAALVERVIGLTGLPSILPAAEPPLGMTARLLIAFATGLIGGLAGLAMARRLAEAQSGAQDFRPINAHEELGNGGLDAPVSRVEPLARAPEAPAFLIEASRGDEVPEFDAPPVWMPEPAVENSEEPEEAADPPLTFIAPSLHRAPDKAEEAEAISEPAPETSAGTPEEDGPAPQILRFGPPIEGEAPAPLSDLDLEQLVQRLGNSLERRRARPSANRSPSESGEFRWNQGEPAVASDEIAQATAAYFGKQAESSSVNEVSRGEANPTPRRKRMESPEQALRDALETLQRMSGAA